jgi:hypothetical protein
MNRMMRFCDGVHIGSGGHSHSMLAVTIQRENIGVKKKVDFLFQFKEKVANPRGGGSDKVSTLHERKTKKRVIESVCAPLGLN